MYIKCQRIFLNDVFAFGFKADLCKIHTFLNSMLFTSAFAVDPIGIGRFDPSMLSDHDRFELFMTFDDPNDIAEELHGDPLDHCSWSGVTCDEGNIISIEWVRPGVLNCVGIPTICRKMRKKNFEK